MSQTLKQEDNLYLQLNVIKVSETFRIASCGFPLSWVSHSTISGNSLECILICFFFFSFVLDDSRMMDAGNIFTRPATIWQHKNTPSVKNSSKLTGGKCHQKRKRRKSSLCSVHIADSVHTGRRRWITPAGGCFVFCWVMFFLHKLLCYLCPYMTVAWNNKFN